MGFSKGQIVYVADGAAAGQYGVIVNTADQETPEIRFANGNTLQLNANNLQTETNATGHWGPPAAITELSRELSGTTAGQAAA